jgi:plasmid stabilization system protein ParE
MKTYEIEYSDEAKADLKDLHNVIVFKYKSPLTAKRYLSELKKTIFSLSKTPDRYSIKNYRSLFRYGLNVRRMDFKKMAIVYTINNSTIYIHRIVAGSMITGL